MPHTIPDTTLSPAAEPKPVRYTSVFFPFAALPTFAANTTQAAKENGLTVNKSILTQKRPPQKVAYRGKNWPNRVKKEFDTEGADPENGVEGIGLLYFGARYYNPGIGLWITVDPALQYWAPYAYANNPIINRDPDGKVQVPYNYPSNPQELINFVFPRSVQERWMRNLENFFMKTSVYGGTAIGLATGGYYLAVGGSALWAGAVYLHSNALMAWGGTSMVLAANWKATVGVGVLSGMIINQLPSVPNTPGLNDVLSLYFPAVSTIAKFTDQALNVAKQLDFSWAYPKGGMDNMTLDNPAVDLGGN